MLFEVPLTQLPNTFSYLKARVPDIDVQANKKGSSSPLWWIEVQVELVPDLNTLPRPST